MKKIALITILVLNTICMGVAIFLFFAAITKASVKKENKIPVQEEKHTAQETVVKIASSPADAKVFINGYYKGKTPAEITVSSASETPKRYEIKVSKQGYSAWTKSVLLMAGDKKFFELELEKE